MNKTLLTTIGLLLILFVACSKQPVQPAASGQPASRFRAGQVWAFKTPPDLPNAKLTVLLVEDGGKVGTIVHVALSGVSYGKGQTTIPHLPFAESAVEQSVTTLERATGPIPDFSEGYQIWREAFDAGQGGVFSIPVADTYEAMAGVVREKK